MGLHVHHFFSVDVLRALYAPHLQNRQLYWLRASAMELKILFGRQIISDTLKIVKPDRGYRLLFLYTQSEYVNMINIINVVAILIHTQMRER